MVSGLKAMNPSLHTYVTNPTDFFSRIWEREASLLIPALILAVGGLCTAVSAYQMTGIMGDLFSGMSGAITTVMMVAAGITGFISIYVTWLILGGVMYLIARYVRSGYSFTRVLQICGYGMIPLIIAFCLTMIIGFYLIPMVEIGSFHLTTMTNADEIQSIVEKATENMLKDPAFIQYSLLSSLITLICLLWCANQWIFGLQAGKALSAKQTVICGGVPAVLYALFLVYSLGTSMGWFPS